MEKDPQVVARLAREREDENWRFRSFLKQLAPRRSAQVNATAERLGRAAEAQMDCRTCGACCRSCRAPLEADEADRLANLLELPVAAFRERHIEVETDGELMMHAPCVFLNGTICSIYEHRPQSCRGYPYIGGDISTRMMGIIERAETCPIVFEMLEGLKREMHFRAWR